MLVRLSNTPKLNLPSVENLRVECKIIYDMNSREVSDVQVDDSAWFCRRMVVFVKMKAQKKLVSLAALLIKQHFNSMPLQACYLTS
eukprot:s5446_g4.t1